MHPTLERLTTETYNIHEVVYYLRMAGYDPEYTPYNNRIRVTMNDVTYEVYVEWINDQPKWNIKCLNINN